MTLASGTRLGPYEVVSLRGKGGMGEVYRGRDVRLDRQVAIKVLPRELAEDPHLRERLRREAKTISQLRHPHICTLHDIGDEQGVDYLVMEYLEGETLEDRLSRGALPLDQVMAIGGQIAEAVAAAHGAGVIHRDLKPGNVMLTRDGAKVLDFGLAKGPQAQATGVGTESPTVTQPLTTAGSLIGTLLYMSPEQLEGKVADARSDLWALGAMLYQMVTGTKPFTGGSQAGVMAAILTARPRAVSELEPSTPARLEWLIGRCLEKNPERRWQSARDLALELSTIGEVSEASLPVATGGRRPRSIVLALGAAVVLLAGLGIGLLLSSRAGGGSEAEEPEPWTTMLLDSTDSRKSAIGGATITPDGRTILFHKFEGGEGGLYRRTLDSLRTQSFAMPRGQHLAGRPSDLLWPITDSRHTLRTMPIEGGEPGAALAEKVWQVGAWGEGGYVYYSNVDWMTEPGVSFAAESHIATWRVKLSGGEPEPLAAGYPTGLLPGDRTLLTTVVRGPIDFANPDIWAVMAVDVGTRASRFLVTGTDARYLDPGFLVFCRPGALWAAPIDSSTGELAAPARSIEEVAMSWSDVHCSFDLSRSGNLVYEAPRAGADLGRLVLVARDGTVEPVTDEIADFFSAIPSLDGRKISVAVRLPDDGFEQRILDLASGSKSRPAQSGSTAGMRWVPPDGREVLFYSDRFEGRGQMFIQPEDGSAPAEQLWPSEQAHRGLDVSADGQQVILTNPGAPGFFVLDRRTGKVRTVAEDGTVLSAAFSPDGDWIVYARSDDKGTRNLWRVPFPGPGEPRQITFDDDDEPIWSIGGDEIYYRGPGHIMAIPVQKSGNDLVTGKARSLFEDHFRRNPFQRGIQNYRQHPDGRLLMIEPADTGEQSLVLVLNWRAKVVQAFADGDGS